MKKTILKIVGIILTIVWAVMMLRSTAFPFIYILVATAGILAIFFDKSSYKEHKALPIISGIILSGAVVLANYGLYGSIFHNKILMLLAVLVVFAGGFAAFFAITKFAVGWTSSGGGLKKVSHKFRAGTVFWFAMAVIAIIDLLVLFLCFYPGITSPDSMNQINQTYTGVYSNHHPVVHTMLIKICLMAGQAVFGTANAGVCCYSVVQILLMSASFAYVIMTLYQMQLSYKVIIPFFICYAVLPYNIFYSFTMWKDVLFGAAMAVLITSMFRIMSGTGRSRVPNYILLAISSVGTCLLRSNGWMAFAVMLVLAIFVLGKKNIKTLVIMAVALVISLLIKGPVFNAMGISKPDILESLAIPMQQIARVLSEGEEITDEQRETLSNIADLDMIAEKYRWDTVDTFKDDIRNTGNPGYIEEHKSELLKLYLEMAKQHPTTFLYAWIDQTKGYWNGGYNIWNWTRIEENDIGIERVTVSEPLANAMQDYAEAFNRVFILKPFISIGLCTWVILILAAAGLAARKKETLFAVPFIVIVLTLVIATPISCEFRYTYAQFAAFPMVFCAILKRDSKD